MTARDPRHDFSLFGGAEVLPPSLRNRSTSLSTSTSSSVATPDLSSDDDEAETRATTPGEELSEEERSPKLPGLEWAPKTVNPPQDGSDFLWMMTEEPHRSRRKAIMKAHPEVRFEFTLSHKFRRSIPAELFLSCSGYEVDGS